MGYRSSILAFECVFNCLWLKNAKIWAFLKILVRNEPKMGGELDII